MGDGDRWDPEELRTGEGAVIRPGGPTRETENKGRGNGGLTEVISVERFITTDIGRGRIYVVVEGEKTSVLRI